MSTKLDQNYSRLILNQKEHDIILCTLLKFTLTDSPSKIITTAKVWKKDSINIPYLLVLRLIFMFMVLTHR